MTIIFTDVIVNALLGNLYSIYGRSHFYQTYHGAVLFMLLMLNINAQYAVVIMSHHPFLTLGSPVTLVLNPDVHETIFFVKPYSTATVPPSLFKFKKEIYFYNVFFMAQSFYLNNFKYKKIIKNYHFIVVGIQRCSKK